MGQADSKLLLIRKRYIDKLGIETVAQTSHNHVAMKRHVGASDHFASICYLCKWEQVKVWG